MGDRVPCRHESELDPGRISGVAAQAVAVQDLAIVQPADCLQAHVRVRRNLHPRLPGDVVGPVVIDEAPGPDQAPPQGGQQASHHRVDSPRVTSRPVKSW